MRYSNVFLFFSGLLFASCDSAVKDGRAVAKKDGPAPCCVKAGVTGTSGVAGGTSTTLSMPGPANMSIYQLPGLWTDQDDRRLPLKALGGRVQLVVMGYTRCGYTCPRLIDEIKSIRNALADSVRDKVGCVLVTLDPERDTPARLRQYAAQTQLFGQWELLQGNEEQVRELSMALNVQYRDLGNGNFSHSAVIIVLDPEGRIVRSLEDTGSLGGFSSVGDVVALIDRLAGS